MRSIKYYIYKLTHPLIRAYWRICKPKTFGAKAILIHETSILLTKNINARYWSLPGGKIDKGETPEHCILRELQEELALCVSKTSFLLGTYSSQQEGKQDTVYVFIVNLPSMLFEKQWELETAKWFPLNALPEDISPAALRRLEEYRSGASAITAAW